MSLFLSFFHWKRERKEGCAVIVVFSSLHFFKEKWWLRSGMLRADIFLFLIGPTIIPDVTNHTFGLTARSLFLCHEKKKERERDSWWVPEGVIHPLVLGFRAPFLSLRAEPALRMKEETGGTTTAPLTLKEGRDVVSGVGWWLILLSFLPSYPLVRECGTKD